MTVPVTRAIAGPYIGTNVVTTYPFGFRVFADEDVRVIETVIATGVVTPLTLNSGYLVTRNPDQDAAPGGTITYAVLGAPTPLPSTKRLTIIGDFDFDQEVDVPTGGPFFATVVEDALDHAVSLSKQLKEVTERSIRIPEGETAGDNLLLPSKELRAGKYTAFDANGDVIVSVGIGSDPNLRTDLASTTVGIEGARLVGYRRPEAGSVGAAVYNVLKRQVWVEDFGGAPGAGDNTAAMNAATLALVALGGGTINIATPGEWRMNWVCTVPNIWVRGFGGHGEYDVYCVRPFSLLTAPITFGDGITDLRYCGIDNLHVSGTNQPGTYNPGSLPSVNPLSVLSANSAPHALLLRGGMIGFRITSSCVLYNGIRTLSCEPTATNPVTEGRFYGHVRNDLTDSDDARGWYEERLADPGYITDNVFFGKINGPSRGYAAEFKNNGGTGIVGEIAGNAYWDVKPFHGIKLSGNAAFRMHNLDLDPGTTPVGVIETDQPLADINRFMSGTLRHGGQMFVFTGTTLDTGTAQGGTANTITIRAPAAFADNALAGKAIKILSGPGAAQWARIASNVGATDVVTIVGTWPVNPTGASVYSIYEAIDIPAEADDFTYQQRLHSPWAVGPRRVGIIGDTAPFQTATFWEMQSAAGPELFTGADLEASKAIRIRGSNAFTSAVLDAVGVNGGLRMDALGTNQNVRLVPSGTGQVVLDGAYTRPGGDNTQDCGGAGNRWKVVYAGTGAINTSDERTKTEISEIPVEWLEAWGDVQWSRFKFNDAIAEKGDGARWHIGLIAQRVVKAFADRGLDATKIGLVCYEEWPDEFEDVYELIEFNTIHGETATVKRPTGEQRLIRPAGNLWMMRYEEALAMECAYLRHKVGS